MINRSIDSNRIKQQANKEEVQNLPASDHHHHFYDIICLTFTIISWTNNYSGGLDMDDMIKSNDKYDNISGKLSRPTLPASNTSTRFESIIVCKRCAIVNIVQWENSFRIVVCIKESVSKSTAAVASSNIKTFVRRNNARVKQNNCRWPTEKLSPPSLT
ncbi:hypothetical protein DERP_014515 [Dermatophagoides pteronyssinus]|uniref:Uncharacterized protein n=1 Tax=Dermatophagoides pteronyssinus TaxID=6956 RepID=A0ABQ8JTJ2_DERPT|nr:hypothetical protein DERP_014515 [Dermatophagoides pteronyssinus]